VKFLKLFSREEKTWTEKELLTAYRQTGEMRFIGDVFQPYMQMVFTICFRYLKDTGESEDAVMNIFEKLVVDLRIHDIENFKSWLHTVTRNHCLMLLRSRPLFMLSNYTDEEIAEPEAMDHFESAALDENLAMLEKCMETLTVHQKVSIELFFNQEKCYREISDQTGYDLIKVKSYIQNGKRNLKICMEKNGKR